MSDLDEHFKNLKEYIKAVANSGDSLNSLFVCSEGGLGKTTSVLKTLKEEGKEKGKDYVYISNYTTILEFYNFLYENNDKIIILDDFEHIFEMGFRFINLLKGALWGIGEDNKRLVTYLTTDEKRKAPEQFEFKGKMFFLLNKIPNNKNPLVQALLSRSLVYNMAFSYSEMIEILSDFSKQEYPNLSQEKRTEILNFLKEKTDKTTTSLNFRTLIKMYDLYKMNPDSWKVLSECLLEKDERLAFLRQCLEESITIKDAERKFCDETCNSRSTFFRLKKKLESLE